ncbi:MAG: hypothetical protein DUD34_07565 [Lactobacillus sp.]|nr:MAG: hypothetical protein DUD34_07565 [Lactobacillus sp.]
MKRECLNRYQINDVNTLRQLVNNYAQWFNNERISRNKNEGGTKGGYAAGSCLLAHVFHSVIIVTSW